MEHSVSRIVLHGTGSAALVNEPWSQELGPDEVAGHAVVSLISPGTELHSFHSGDPGPRGTGYASVIRVDSVGSDVVGISPGDHVFCFAEHASRARAKVNECVRVPEGLDAKVAVFARLMAVSWSTLMTTNARPGDRVLVMGLGIVGNLASQVFAAAGYEVTAVDPQAERLSTARASGLRDVRAEISPEDESATFALAMDCSGHEAAVFDAARVLVAGGELVLIGAPWQRRTQMNAFDLLHLVFNRYIVLRSGWEWQLPLTPEPRVHGSVVGSVSTALGWLRDGRIDTSHLASVESPAFPDRVFARLGTGRELTALFDWTILGEGQR